MKKLFITLCLAAFMLSGTVAAQVFVSGAAGRGDTDTWPDDPSVYSLSAGYQFNDYLAAAVSYVDFGETKNDIALEFVEADGIDIGIMGILPLGERIELFAKLGYVSWDLKYTNLVWWISDRYEGEDINYGVGAAVKITRKFSLFAEYHIYSFEFDGGADDDLTTLTGGLRVLF